VGDFLIACTVHTGQYSDVKTNTSLPVESNKTGCIGTALGGGFLFLWCAFWTGGTVYFDYKGIHDLWRQNRTSQYASTTGTVTDSRIETYKDDEGGTSYTPKIMYEYYVDGRRYLGYQWRHGASSSTKRTANEWSGAHPVGSDVTVYYDAAEPQTAVLMRGIEGLDFSMLIFAIPFNAIMIGCFWAAYFVFRMKFLKPPAGGVHIIDNGIQTRVRLPDTYPFFYALGTAAGIAFVSIFVIGFAFNFSPPLPLVAVFFTVIFTTAVLVYLRYARPLQAGEMDLIIDDARQVVTLPASYGRAPFIEVRRADLRDVYVDLETTRDSDNDPVHKYHVTLRHRANDRDNTDRLIHFNAQDRADGLSHWLKTRLKIGGAAPGQDGAEPQ
jgi:hypothetical protein